MNNRNPEMFSLASCVNSPEGYTSEPRLYCSITDDAKITVAVSNQPYMVEAKGRPMSASVLYKVVSEGLVTDTVRLRNSFFNIVGVEHKPTVTKGDTVMTSPVEIGDLKIYADGSFSVKDIVFGGKRRGQRVADGLTTLTRGGFEAARVQQLLNSNKATTLFELELDYNGHLILHTATVGEDDIITIESGKYDPRVYRGEFTNTPMASFMGLSNAMGPVGTPKDKGLYSWTNGMGLDLTLRNTEEGGNGYVLTLNL